MSVSVQEPAVRSDLPDFRSFPIADVTTAVSPDLSDIMRRVMPLSSDPERPAVSAFNSSI
jgi:FXSXX-COOH protein